MDQNVKIGLDQCETRNVKTEGGVRQGCYLSPILFNFSSAYPTKEAPEGFGDVIEGTDSPPKKGCRITGEWMQHRRFVQGSPSV
jgi:hypothetical protein